jgi:hypothetical protein
MSHPTVNFPADVPVPPGDVADDFSAPAGDAGPIDLDGDMRDVPGNAAEPLLRATNLHRLAPREQRALLLTHPQRIAKVTHVAPPVHFGDGLLLIVLDGPSNAEVSGLPAPRARSASDPDCRGVVGLACMSPRPASPPLHVTWAHVQGSPVRHKPFWALLEYRLPAIGTSRPPSH